MSEQIPNSSDNYQIDVLSINGRDVRNDYLGLAIHENIFSNVTTLSIDFIDEIGILELAEWEEDDTELKIVYFNRYMPFHPKLPAYEATFQLYKTERVKPLGQGKRIYRLHFVSKEYHTNFKKMISRPWRDKSSTEIIESLFGFLESQYSFNIEPSDDVSPLFVCPNLRPIQAINLLCREALKRGNNDYVFFQRKNEFRCETLTTLKSKGPVLKYIMEQTALDWQEDKKKEPFNIISYHIDKYDWNTIENVDQGMYGSRLLVRDQLTKEHEWFESIQKDSPISDVHNAHYYDHWNYHNREVVQEYFQERMGNISKNNVDRVILTVPCNSGISVGDTVDLELPTNRQFSLTDPMVVKEGDAHLNGKHLLLKVKTEITPDESKMILETVKV